jgi:hypothetical protein
MLSKYRTDDMMDYAGVQPIEGTETSVAEPQNFFSARLRGAVNPNYSSGAPTPL